MSQEIILSRTPSLMLCLFVSRVGWVPGLAMLFLMKRCKDRQQRQQKCCRSRTIGYCSLAMFLFSFTHISRPLGCIIGKAENNDF